MKWWGHLQRMEECRTVGKIFECSPIGKRSRGRPKNRWWEKFLKDIGVLGAKNWTTVVMDRSAWHGLVKSKTHRGLLNERRRRRKEVEEEKIIEEKRRRRKEEEK